MPHLRIEFSPGAEALLGMAGFCRTAHQAMVETGIFPLGGIRVRAHRADYCVVADDDHQTTNDFVAMQLMVGAGRDEATLKAAGDHVFAALQAYAAGPLSTPYFALSLELVESHPVLNWKDTPIHARLKGKMP